MNKWVRLSFLILGAGTIYKLQNLKVVFYVPMVEDWGLTNLQIGLGFTVFAIVQTMGYFVSMMIADWFSKKILLPAGLIGVSLSGVYLSTLPPFYGYLVSLGTLALFSEVLYWPVLLKAVRLLGTNTEQGRMFGFLETGRGVVDVVIAFGALFIFVQFGEGRPGLQAGLIFYTVITMIVGIITYFLVEDDKIEVDATSTIERNKALDGIKKIIGSLDLWLVAMTIFFVYATFIGITYFIPFMKDIYLMPVALVGVYGIVNQFGLKIVGGPIGGFLADKVCGSPAMYLKWTFLLSMLLMILFVQLPHQSMSIYVVMVATLSFCAIVFSQRAVFFAPMDEVGVPRKYAGSAMAFACLVGYLPSMFGYTVYGYFLDNFEGITGYNYVFYTMIVFSFCGFITASILTKRLKGRPVYQIESIV
jgi:sugar phosphate permease